MAYSGTNPINQLLFCAPPASLSTFSVKTAIKKMCSKLIGRSSARKPLRSVIYTSLRRSSMRKNSRIPYLLVSWSVGLLVFVGCSNSVETNINTCQIDRDCRAGLSCQSGLCRSAEDQSVVSVCEVDQDCLSGQWCQSGFAWAMQ